MLFILRAWYVIKYLRKQVEADVDTKKRADSEKNRLSYYDDTNCIS